MADHKPVQADQPPTPDLVRSAVYSGGGVPTALLAAVYVTAGMLFPESIVVSG